MMKVRVHIRPILYKSAINPLVAEVEGNTVGQCLDQLVRQFPGIEKDLFSQDGKLLSYIHILINGKPAHPPDLARPLKHGDQLYVVPMLEGG